MIDGQLHASEGKSLINFSQTLPPENSDMAVQVLRDPYNFGFLTLAHPLEEHKLERGPARPHAGSVARARPRLRLRRQPSPAHSWGGDWSARQILSSERHKKLA
jgi:hypothetical protein